MLIDKSKGLVADETIILKISSGEEIIVKIKEVIGDEIHTESPFRIIMTQQGMALAPFSVIANQDGIFKFFKSQIICYYALSSEIEKEYIRASTGIEIAL